MSKYILIISGIFALISCKSPMETSSSKHKYTNKLIDETSPYLLQHAHNPVNWYPWGEEALAKAKKENKLLIISIGYAACHWCHVMEKESFEDTTVARIMNSFFVPIKVDREERPDVDDIYMTACHLVSGRGGWPLNAFALPDGRPVWAGTYFPKDQWLSILERFIELAEKDRPKLEDSADRITKGIQNADEIALIKSDNDYTRAELDAIAENMVTSVDFKDGGRKGAPKFPMPNNYEFLLKYFDISQDEKSLEAVQITLDKMSFGGIYDHLGGGFARYSVDAYWIVPHFEKMLYDNGQLVSLYSQAYQLTKNPWYKQVVEESCEFISRELTSPEQGFYSSLDADSEGEEGKFYVWTNEEIEALISDEQERKIFKDYYTVKSAGNWEHGKNILYREKKMADFLKQHELSEAELQEIIEKNKSVLFKERSKRIRPGLDDKILTSWNALMLKGYVDAYRAFGNEDYLNRALANGSFILENQLDSNHRLNRNFKNGISSINGFLDDYALTIDAFISLYQVTFDESWLNHAKDLCQYTLDHFHKESNAMFNFTSDLDPPLVARKSELSDNVIPGSNSVMARNLFHLGSYFYNTEWLDLSKQMINNLKETLTSAEMPSFYSNWCQLFTSQVKAPYEIAIVGQEAGKLRNEMMQQFIPNTLLLGGQDEGSLQLLKNKKQEGQSLIYVCQNKVCKFPVETVEEALAQMK
jgi:uncharacterized protein YyaL (SSP411 family)